MVDEPTARRIAREEARKVAEEVIEPIATRLMGPKRSTIEGGGRHYELGALRKLDDLHDAFMSNGHQRQLPAQITLQSFDRHTKIIVALIAALPTVAAIAAALL